MTRVVITGLGTVNPTGLSVQEAWDNIINGRTGVAPLSLFDSANFPVKIAAEVKNFDPAKYMEVRETRRRDRYQHFAAAASQEALKQAGLVADPERADRYAVLVSSCLGGGKAFQDGVRALDSGGPRKINVFLTPMLMSNGAGGLIGIENGFRGPNFAVASACASSNDAIGQAWMMLRSGVADAAVVGGSEATLI